MDEKKKEQQQGWRYQPTGKHIQIGDAVAFVYYSASKKRWRLHDGIYLGGPHKVFDSGTKPQAGTQPYMLGHYRSKHGDMCHEVIYVNDPHRIIKTSSKAYKTDTPAIVPYTGPCGTGNTINPGRAVAIKLQSGLVKNGLLLHKTCILFPKHNGTVAINHFVLSGGEFFYTDPQKPPKNSDILERSHTFHNVSFVKEATLSMGDDCKTI